MGMHDAVNVAAATQNEDMHRDFKGGPPAPLDDRTLLIHDDNIFGGHTLIIGSAWRDADQPTLRVTGAQVALCSLHELTVGHFFCVTHYFGAQFRQ